MWLNHPCPISWDKAFSREFACPIIYNLPTLCWIVSLSLHIENSWHIISYRPFPHTTWNLDAGARKLRPPEPPASTMPMSTTVAPDTYVGQGVVEPASLAWACHNLGVSTTCVMTLAGHSPSTLAGDCNTVHMLITPAVAALTHDLARDSDCPYTHLHKQVRDRNRVLVEPPRDGTQSCLHHIVATFVGQPMTQVRRDFGAWYLLPANQARLWNILPTHLKTPAEWSWRSWLALNPSNLEDECDVYSLVLLLNVSIQILSSTTSIQVINIHGMRGMTVGHVNSTRVKLFVGTKMIRNTGNVSSAVTHKTMEVPTSQQNVTQSKRRKVNVPPNPAVLFNTWSDSPPPGVAFDVRARVSSKG